MHITWALMEIDIEKAVKSIFLQTHQPPGRNCFPLLAYPVMGISIPSMRVPNIAIWSLVSVMAFLTAYRETRSCWSVFCGLWISLSGLYGIMISGIGFGVFTFLLMLFFYLSLSEKAFDLQSEEGGRLYFWTTIVGFIASVWFLNMLAILFSFMAMNFLVVLRSSDRRNLLWVFFKKSLPIVSLLSLYFILTVAGPLFMNKFSLWPETWSQNIEAQMWTHFKERFGTSKLNISSLVENLKSINAYFFPFVSWGLFGVACLQLNRLSVRSTCIFLPYLFMINFYLRNMTGTHFIPVFVTFIPFSFIWMYKKYERRPFIVPVASFAILCVVFFWGKVLHMNKYRYGDYPRHLVEKTFSKTYWNFNITIPSEEIDDLLEETVKLKYKNLICDMSSAAKRYYFKRSGMGNLSLNDLKIKNTWDIKKQDIQKYKLRTSVARVETIFNSDLIDHTIIIKSDPGWKVVYFKQQVH
jgi:MFS family permease